MAVPAEYEWFLDINNWYIRDTHEEQDVFQNVFTASSYYSIQNGDVVTLNIPDLKQFSFVGQFANSHKIDSNTNTAMNFSPYGGIIRVDINSQTGNTTFSSVDVVKLITDDPYYELCVRWTCRRNLDLSAGVWFEGQPSQETYPSSTVYGGLYEALTSVYNRFCNVEVYVDGEKWVSSQSAYTWTPLSSITGKEGTLSLSTIEPAFINNGNPVTGATSDTFHSTEDSKVEELVTYATPIDPSKSESFTCVYQTTPPFVALKLLVKKNSAPQDEEDADLVVNLPNPVLSTGIDEYTATNLDPLTDYFCVVQVSDSGGHYKYSDPAEVRTGFMDRNFDYTGSIQTFTAPKTGIYQLETWGAQGGDASDGTLTARGGYGAYAVGEVFLTQGDTLYINVGGQNGYGGGGNMNIQKVLQEFRKNEGFDNTISITVGVGGDPFINNTVKPYYLTNKDFIGLINQSAINSINYTNEKYVINGKGQVYYIFALNRQGYNSITFDINASGTMTSGTYKNWIYASGGYVDGNGDGHYTSTDSGVIYLETEKHISLTYSDSDMPNSDYLIISVGLHDGSTVTFDVTVTLQ